VQPRGVFSLAVSAQIVDFGIVIMHANKSILVAAASAWRLAASFALATPREMSTNIARASSRAAVRVWQAGSQPEVV
jgi:hypothetical protein